MVFLRPAPADQYMAGLRMLGRCQSVSSQFPQGGLQLGVKLGSAYGNAIVSLVYSPIKALAEDAQCIFLQVCTCWPPQDSNNFPGTLGSNFEATLLDTVERIALANPKLARVVIHHCSKLNHHHGYLRRQLLASNDTQLAHLVISLQSLQTPHILQSPPFTAYHPPSQDFCWEKVNSTRDPVSGHPSSTTLKLRATHGYNQGSEPVVEFWDSRSVCGQTCNQVASPQYRRVLNYFKSMEKQLVVTA